MGDAEKKPTKSDDEANDKINDPLVHSDVEAPRQPFEADEEDDA